MLTSRGAVLFNYTILRDTKDVLVVTAPGSGAEIIPFLKVCDLAFYGIFSRTLTRPYALCLQTWVK